jgi:hypothetical protein
MSDINLSGLEDAALLLAIGAAALLAALGWPAWRLLLRRRSRRDG